MTSTPTPQQILALPMRPNDSGADTIGGYLIALLTKLWQEGYRFSGKYPFGNSDWKWDVYAALVDAGYANNPFDEDGYVTSSNDFDEKAARQLIADAIEALRPAGPTEYIVIRQSILGSPDHVQHFYEQDGPRHPSAEKAVSHGWETFGHDDFNIGHVQGDRLIWFGWMSDPIGETDEDFAEIARQLELTPDRRQDAGANA
jgi:hypothetical protein